MPVFLIVDIEVNDPETYAQYVARVPATVEQYGGRYVVRTGDAVPVWGGWEPDRLIILEFPDRETLDTWRTSPEYAEVAPLRERSTKTRSIIVQGFDSTAPESSDRS